MQDGMRRFLTFPAVGAFVLLTWFSPETAGATAVAGMGLLSLKRLNQAFTTP